ncbi:MAG: hypothetical protein AB7F41_10215 [Methylocystis sp.]|uniref:hypothetical protein n=1 Tax=Methylocystis sp. TaxID=1911079 RepID=UPI003D0D7CE8
MAASKDMAASKQSLSAADDGRKFVLSRRRRERIAREIASQLKLLPSRLDSVVNRRAIFPVKYVLSNPF